ncbi:MAG: hypothetical protein ACREJC_03920 [Tepidisphaeraceae bacterium]
MTPNRSDPDQESPRHEPVPPRQWSLLFLLIGILAIPLVMLVLMMLGRHLLKGF